MNYEKSLHLALDKILANDFFQEREVYANLLKYLVQSYLSGNTPKEVTIAHEIFNKNTFNAAEDTTVRVHMFNLRKKLDEYYQGPGHADAIKILIPKGHYRIQVVEKEPPAAVVNHKKVSPITVILLILLSLAIGYIGLDKWYLEEKNNYFEVLGTTDPVWGHFFQNGYATSVVIGDFLVFHEYHSILQRSRRIQDYEINTKSELKTYIQNHPENYPEEWFLGEIPHNSLTNIIDLQPVFLAFKQKIKINFTTEIDIDFIKNRNLVYIGEFKNLRALADLISMLPVNYKTLPWWHGKISFNSGDSIVTLQTAHDWGISRYVVDLALVAKLPGQNKENYILIAGFGYNSQIKAVELLSHKSALKTLENQITARYGSIPPYFTMVLEVTGFDRASTNAEIKFFHEVKADYFQQYHYPTFKP